jgi:hypothetical protein
MAIVIHQGFLKSDLLSFQRIVSGWIQRDKLPATDSMVYFGKGVF